MRLCGACALLALLFLSSLDSSESFETTVKPKKGSEVTVSSKLPDCTVCAVSGVNGTQKSCESSLNLVPEVEVKILFTCSQNIDQSYGVMVNTLIECTDEICQPNTAEVQSSLLPSFTRTFSWKLKAPEKTLVSLSIQEGLTETSNPCSDGLQYLVVTSEVKDPTRYCRGGSETRLILINEAVVSLEAKPAAPVDQLLFRASPEPKKHAMNVSIGPGSTVVLSRDPGEAECEVCVTGGAGPECSSTEKTLKSAENLSLEFKCLNPQDVFSMKMTTKIDCTKTSCTPAVAEVDPELFKGFKKSITWNINVPERTALTLDFPGNGLKQITASEKCEDSFQYVVSNMKSDGQKKTTSYCRGGTASELDFLGETTVTVEVPKGGELDRSVFSLKAAPRLGRSMFVTSDPDTIVIIKREPKEPDCEICVTKDSKQTCNSQQQRLQNPHNTSVEFTCPQPERVFSVEINRDVDCTQKECSGSTVHTEKMFFPKFNRIFTWDFKVNPGRAFQLDFAETGLRQVPNEETCPDGHTYSVTVYLRTGPANIGTFCKGGTVTTILALYKGRVILKVPGDAELDPVNFKLNAGPETKMAAIVKVNLPRGVTETDFLTPNYPRDFPDRQQMQWEFTVPAMHNYSVHFRNHSAPGCLSVDNEVLVEYQMEDNKVTKLTLTNPQPQHQQGNFKLVLKNCETNRTLPGLSLGYRVSVMRSGHPVVCTVDLTRHQSVSMQIEKVGSDPSCEISLNSEVKEKINVAEGTTAKLSFLDCSQDEIHLTAKKAIVCEKVASCPSALLSVPTLDSCLPVPLSNFTWHLTIPKDATLDLVSPKGNLHQWLPGEKCNQSYSLHLAQAGGYLLGNFCSSGVIGKLQVHDNISITAMSQDLKNLKEPLLNYSITPEITETMIFMVYPKMSSPTILATPNWPQGMKSFSTVSFVVEVPPQYDASLQFLNVSKHKCDRGHTSIKVMLRGQKEELMSRDENETPENLWVKKSFYLNMSNCKPEERNFGVRIKIDLIRKTNLLAILLGLAGALLVLLIVLAVVCIVIRKKKAKMNRNSSIYMGGGNIFRPNDKHFIKPQSDNDTHIYDYIDETMVYGHLLDGSTYGNSEERPTGMPMDSYKTFMGPTEEALPVVKEPEPGANRAQYQTFLDPSETFLPPRPRTPIGRQDSLGFQDRRMMDNELYTFKSTGDITTIPLCSADEEPEPPIMEESL